MNRRSGLSRATLGGLLALAAAGCGATPDEAAPEEGVVVDGVSYSKERLDEKVTLYAPARGEDGQSRLVELGKITVREELVMNEVRARREAELRGETPPPARLSASALPGAAFTFQSPCYGAALWINNDINQTGSRICLDYASSFGETVHLLAFPDGSIARSFWGGSHAFMVCPDHAACADNTPTVTEEWYCSWFRIDNWPNGASRRHWSVRASASCPP
jgi:hypothetical protein